MGIREPVKLTAASMSLKGKKPDELCLAPSTSHPEPDLLKLTIRTSSPVRLATRAMDRATTSVEKAHGTYEHWLWPIFRKGNPRSGLSGLPRRATWCLPATTSAWTVSEGKDLFRQRVASAATATKAMTRNPKTCSPSPQQIKQIDQEKKDNLQASRRPDEAGR